ncbi:MAG: hypothetical protein WC342_09395 [Methanoregula sp.]|jgi:hypothetical protein
MGSTGEVMRVQKRPTYSYLLLVIVLILVDTFLAWISVALSPGVISGTGTALIYVAVAFMILFTLWFGMYGAIAAYVGGFFGAGIFNGMPASVATYWALANLWQVLIPLVAFRVFDVNVGMESNRDLFHLVLFGVILNNLVGAAWGSIALAIGGLITPSQIMGVFGPWLVVNMLITILIVPIALGRLTPKVSGSKVFVRGYWF